MTRSGITTPTFEPAYLKLGLPGLRRRAEDALSLLRSCEVCPRDCHVDRLADQWSFCKIGRYAVVSSAFPHFGEEDCLRGWNGSGTIFFSMCNLRCAFCIRPDTRILTDQGFRKVEEIFLSGEGERQVAKGHVRFIQGLRSWTHAGMPARIVKAYRHAYRGELLVIKPLGLPPTALTPNHIVFAVGPELQPKKLAARDLTESHFLLVPKLVEQSTSRFIDTRTLLSQFVGTFRRRARRVSTAALEEAALTVGGRVATSAQVARRLGYHPAYLRSLLPRIERGDIRNENTVVNDLIEEGTRIRFKTEKRPGIRAHLTLDDSLVRLLGYYCAEGHVHSQARRPNSHQLVFSFGQHERRLAQRTQALMREVFGTEPRLISRRTTTTIETGRASLSLFFKGLCGSNSRVKQVPEVMFSAPTSLVRAFLEAYFEGDGTRQAGLVAANTVSPDLAYGIVALLLRLGIFPYFYATPRERTQVIEGRKVNQAQTLYYVKCRVDAWEPSHASPRTRYRQTDKAFFVPIRAIERVDYDGYVYNLEIDAKDHSYVANGIAVGNCQNADISHQRSGQEVTPDELATLMLRLQDQGCHNINFVTPEHVVPQILEALPLAVERGLHLPLVYNTSAYDSMHSLDLLDGIVDIYMPDFKFWDREMSRLYVKAPDYPEVARRTIKEMHRQVGPLRLDEHGLAVRGVLIRHLVMPGGIAGTPEIMRWIAEELSPDSYVNVMAQYRPAGYVGRVDRYEAINRRITSGEYAEAIRAAHDAGLHRLDGRVI